MSIIIVQEYLRVPLVLISDLPFIDIANIGEVKCFSLLCYCCQNWGEGGGLKCLGFFWGGRGGAVHKTTVYCCTQNIYGGLQEAVDVLVWE